jgi:DNA-binding GntR family transcriptional regulator
MTDGPRYREIADDLRTRLAAGEFPVGTALPAISDLQTHYDVPGLNTIRQAQQILQEEGLIKPRQGRGTFVIALPAEPGDQATIRAAAAALGETLNTAQTQYTQLMRLLGAPPD